MSILGSKAAKRRWSNPLEKTRMSKILSGRTWKVKPSRNPWRKKSYRKARIKYARESGLRRHKKDPQFLVRQAQKGGKASVKRFETDKKHRNRMHRLLSKKAKEQHKDPKFIKALFAGRGYQLISRPQISLFKSLCARGFKGIRLEYPVPPFSIDMAFPKQKIAIEVDGSYWHNDKDRWSRKAKKRRRDRFLKHRGWVVYHVSAEAWRESKIWEKL